MTRRTITVTLTEAQYEAILSAMTDSEAMDADYTFWNGDAETAMPRKRQQLIQARENAWSKIREAWHAKARKQVA